MKNWIINPSRLCHLQNEMPQTTHQTGCFAPTTQHLIIQIKAWSLLLKWAQVGKGCSHYLSRVLGKANLQHQERTMGITYLQQHLKQAYPDYYLAKGNASQMRESYLYELAEAQAEHRGGHKERIYKTMVHIERQRQKPLS